MAQGFYTLEEAARRLGMSTEELSGMAQRHEVRAFMDRNTWRFRAQDVDELARQRGVPSDPSVPAMPAHHDPDTGSITQEISPFEIQDLTEVMTSPHEEEDIGVDLFASSVDDARRRASDSGVVLGARSGIDLAAEHDPGGLGSSILGGPPKSGVKPPSSKMKKPPSSKHPAPPGMAAQAKEDDSVVPIGRETLGSPGDSAVRLDGLSGRLPDSGVRLVDFDDLPGLSGLVAPPSSSTRLSATKPPTVRSEPEVVSKLPPSAPDITTDLEKTQAKGPSSAEFEFGSSAEFDLTPSAGPGPSDSVFDLSTPSMESIELQVTSDLEDSGTSAIELEQVQQPVTGRAPQPLMDPDASDDSVTFELTMEDEAPVRRSGRHKQPINSSFELSLEQPETTEPVSEQSDSDFELTLDDSSSSVEVDAKAPAAASDDSESSDFELALDDDSISEVVDDTGSEVVVLEDDVTKAAPAAAVVETDEVVAEADDEAALAVVEAADEAPVTVVPGKEITTIPADWGWWSLVLVPTTLVMLFTGFLLFEMIRNTWSYSEPGPMAAPVFRMMQERTK